MTSKKPAASKRASLPRASDYTREFQNDWQGLSHSGRYNMNVLKEVMLLLVANDGPLPAEWLDHPLTGDWQGHRECHAGGDFFLVYRIDDSGKTGLVVFVRALFTLEFFDAFTTQQELRTNSARPTPPNG